MCEEKGADLLGLMGGEIVGDDVDFASPRLRLDDGREKGDKLIARMTRHGADEHLTRVGIERRIQEDNMTGNVPTTRDDLVVRLRRAGELLVSGDNQVETDSYVDTRQFRFHGPDGFEADYSGLTKRSHRWVLSPRTVNVSSGTC